jgi:nucleotide-binding universal stress UspA family protein
MKVLIGYDGSECAQAAVTDLQRAGLPAERTEAAVLTATDVVLPADPDPARPGKVVLRDVERLRGMARDAVDRARATAEEGAARVGGLFPGWSVRAEGRADTPHWALVGMATDWSADLVVLGSQGRSALGRLLLGSTSQMVLQHAACSVRIGRCAEGGGDRPPRGPGVRLVLGVDGSVDSAAAASAVAGRPWPAGSEVRVVGVLDSRVLLSHLQQSGPPPGGGPPRDQTAEAAAGLQGSLDKVCEDLRRAGLAATAKLLPGEPKKVLLEEADRFGADCIVVGAKGHSRLERLLLGSVSAAVTARAGCSVEVVRHG